MSDSDLTLTLTRETVRKLVAAVEDNEFYAAVVAAQAGESLDDCLITEWSQHWPVIDGDLNLTGEAVDSDDPHHWYNYDDLAAIFEDVARDAGWDCPDEDGGSGYASPPEDAE